MKSLKKKLSLAIVDEGPDEIWKMISSKINSETISDPRLIELAMGCLIYKDKIKILLKYLKIDKVPPPPVDTMFDTGRRFFYLLKIVNRRSGYQLIEPYLENINCNREQEFRFLGGMYFGGVSLEKARNCFKKALDLSDVYSLNRFSHRHLFHNYIICLSYLDEVDVFNEFIEKNYATFERFDSIGHVNRLKIMELIKSKDVGKALNEFNKRFGFPIDEAQEDGTGLINLQLSYFSKINDEKNFLKFLGIYQKNLKTRIGEGRADPTRAIGYLKYIFELGGMDSNEMFKFIGKDISYYPFYQVDFSPCRVKQDDKIMFGGEDRDNYLFPYVEEYCINGIHGIGFSKEIKLIYNLVLSGDLGMSFEELSFHINGEHDYSGLLLLHDRIKQVLLRVKNVYQISVERSNYRAYISKSDRDKFYVNYKHQLTINNEFSKVQFMEIYKLSEFTTKLKLKKYEEDGIISKKKSRNKNIYIKIEKIDDCLLDK